LRLFSLFLFLSDPNVGVPVNIQWPKYDLENRKHLLVREPCSTGRNFGEKTYKFWNEIIEPMFVTSDS